MADDGDRRSSWPWIAAVVAGVYLLPFLAALLEELVLKTGALRHLPAWVKPAFQVVYAPLIRIVELFLR